MTQTFNISGMTCEACEYKIQHVLSQIPNVSSVIAKHSNNLCELRVKIQVKAGQQQPI